MIWPDKVPQRPTLKRKKMAKLNAIGLDIKKSKVLAEKLNELLADYSVFYQNVRGYLEYQRR